MAKKKCFFCNKKRELVYHITEINGTEIELIDICRNCGDKYIESLANEQNIEITSTVDVPTTVNEIIDLIKKVTLSSNTLTCIKCGMTNLDFETEGRMGCDNCYDLFKQHLETYVYPYHGADQHIGKRPRRIINDKEEKIKYYKLNLAKAIETEKYEEASEYKKILDSLTNLE